MWLRKPSLWFLFFFSVVCVSSDFVIPHANFISYDNFGYYMHLPAKYIYNDVALETEWYKEINAKYNVTPTYFQIAPTEKGGIIMRFYKGMSYLWTPAFFIAHYYAKTHGYPADGFSAPYQWALIMFGALWSILGFLVTRKLLLRFFNETITTISLFLILMGTNFLYFVSFGNDTPHAYLFTLFVIFIWFTLKWHEKPRYKYAISLGITLGLIIAIRPSDVFIIAFPLLFGVYNKYTLERKISTIRQNYLQIALAGIIAALFFVPQLLYYRQIAGEYVINIYNDPGAAFDLLRPRFAHVLFGFRKGWFIYSPLSILGFVGIIFVYRKFKEYFWPVVIYLALVIYLIASFNSLISYGWRGFIQAYATLVIPTGFFVEYLLKRKLVVKIFASIVILLLTALNIHQSYQVKMGIIDGSRMTMRYYFRIIGKNTVTDDDRKLLLVQRSVTPVDVIPDDIPFNNIELDFNEFEEYTINDTTAPEPFSGKGMFEMNNKVNYSPVYRNVYKKITDEYYCYLRASVMVFSYEPIENDLLIVITTTNRKGGHIKYRANTSNDDMNKFVPGQWNKLTINYQTPEIYSGNERIESMVWYRGKGRAWIDDFKVMAYTIDGIPENKLY